VTRAFSLAHLTVLSLAPPEMVDVAARTGYQAVGLRLIAVTADTPGYPLMDDAPMLRATRARLAASGIGVNDIEFVRLTPETQVARLEGFVAAGAEIGARHIVAAPYDPDLGRLAQTLAALADLAVPYGLGVVLEFFPWTVVPKLPAAVRVVEAAGRTNVGILLDTLHFHRSGSRLDDLDRIPPSRLPFLHLCDAEAAIPTTLDGLLHTARAERLPPGEGAIDIASIVRRMPQGIPVGLEVPMEGLTREIGPEGVALRVRQAATRFFDSL
jgi:sugar phosphate isomerase/epimerase